MSIKTLFVCRGNTCRSPLCEAIFNRLIEDNPTLQAKLAFAQSAGVGTYTNQVSSGALRVGKSYGLKAKLQAHNCTQIARSHFENYDNILCMDCDNKKMLRYFAGQWYDSQNATTKMNKVAFLRSFDSQNDKKRNRRFPRQSDPEIDDPIGAQVKVYRDVYFQCLRCIKSYICNAIDDKNFVFQSGGLDGGDFEQGMKNVLFLCMSNTTRSPLCEAIFNEIRSQNEALRKMFNPASSGAINTSWDSVVNYKVVAAARSLGRSWVASALEDHLTSSTYEDMFENNEHILVIGQSGMKTLHAWYGRGSANMQNVEQLQNVGSDGQPVDIIDPLVSRDYPNAYEILYHQCELAVQNFVKKQLEKK